MSFNEENVNPIIYSDIEYNDHNEYDNSEYNDIIEENDEDIYNNVRNDEEISMIGYLIRGGTIFGTIVIIFVVGYVVFK